MNATRPSKPLWRCDEITTGLNGLTLWALTDT